MSSYTEKPVNTDFDIALGRIALFFIILLLSYGLKVFFDEGSALFVIYALVLVALWIWRCGISYIYTISDAGITIERTGFWMKKTWFYPLTEVEGVVLYFKRKLFQKDVVGSYISRFSSLDANNIHLIIVNEGGKRKGIMIKSTDRFFKRLKKNQPGKVQEMV